MAILPLPLLPRRILQRRLLRLIRHHLPRLPRLIRHHLPRPIQQRPVPQRLYLPIQ